MIEINKTLKKIKRRLKIEFFTFLTALKKVDNNKILFITSRGTFNCNPSFIAEELKKYKNLKLVWAYNTGTNTSENNYPNYLKLVSFDSYDFYREAASSKIWIDNSIGSSYRLMIKKRKQLLIQTWHGSLGLKRFDTYPDKRWQNRARKSAKWTNYIISNSKFETDLYKNTFWNKTEILEYGHPRNDIFFNEALKKERRKKVFNYYKLDENTNYCLFAPTFRDDEKNYNPELNFEKLIKILSERFGGKWKIVIRKHFLINSINTKYSKNIIEASDYPDIQDLLIICNVGITDYSSWICDYLLLYKPAFLFCPDYDNYQKKRGLLYPLEETPFPVAKNEKELFKAIQDINIEDYEKKCKKFILGKGCVDDGNASKRTAKKILDIIDYKQD